MPPSDLRILCVENDPDVCELLTMTLRFHGFDAVGVPEVAAALDLMAREKFRLFVLDGQLPGVSGLSLCQEIRGADKETPVVIFSGRGGESDRNAAVLAGADAYVVKPDVSEIVTTVERLLGRSTS
jgi:two-component system OmpR family response regulator